MKGYRLICLVILILLSACEEKVNEKQDLCRKRVTSKENLKVRQQINHQIAPDSLVVRFQYMIDYAHCNYDVSDRWREPEPKNFTEINKKVGKVVWLDLILSSAPATGKLELFIGRCHSPEGAKLFLDYQKMMEEQLGHRSGNEKNGESKLVFSCGSYVFIALTDLMPGSLEYANRLKEIILSGKIC